MQVTTYLSFNGQCEAALTLYERILGGQLGPIFRYAAARWRTPFRPSGRTRSCMPA
jgi:uncharacterized glyoxalase superfamily protein PhnB